MPRKASTRRTTATAVHKKGAVSQEEEYERAKKQEMALAYLANEVERRVRMINDEAESIINCLESTYGHCIRSLTQEQQNMLWVDYEASQAAPADKAVAGATIAEVVDGVKLLIPEAAEAGPPDRKGRRKRMGKALKGSENQEKPATKLTRNGDTHALDTIRGDANRPDHDMGPSSSDTNADCKQPAVPETPAPSSTLSFKYLSATVSNTERRPRPKEKIALTSAATGSPLVLEKRVCVLVDGQNVLDLKSGELLPEDVSYLQSLMTRLKKTVVPEEDCNA